MTKQTVIKPDADTLCKGELLATIAGVCHSALRQDPYKSLLESCKTSPNTFTFIDSVKLIIEHKTDTGGSVEVNGQEVSYEAERARKTWLEAEKLQDEQNLRRQKWAPISEMEAEWTRQLRASLELCQSTVDDIKSRVDLTAEQLEEIDVIFAKGMNKVAGEL